MWHTADEEQADTAHRSQQKRGHLFLPNHPSRSAVTSVESKNVEVELMVDQVSYCRCSSTTAASTLLVNAASIGNPDASGGVAPPYILEFVLHRGSAAEQQFNGRVV